MLKQHESPVFSLVAKRIGSLPNGIPSDGATQLLLRQASQLLPGKDGAFEENMLPQWMHNNNSSDQNEEEEEEEEEEKSTVVDSTNNNKQPTLVIRLSLKNASIALQQIKVDSKFTKLALLPHWSLTLRNKHGKKVVVMVGNGGGGGMYEDGLLLGMKRLLERKGIEGRIVDDIACDVVAACYDCY